MFTITYVICLCPALVNTYSALQEPLVTHIAVDDSHTAAILRGRPAALLDSQVSWILLSSVGRHPSVHMKKILLTLLIMLPFTAICDKHFVQW